MFNGIDIRVVKSGTVIEHKGKEMEVSDGNMVQEGRKIYLTQKDFDAVKASIERKSEQG